MHKVFRVFMSAFVALACLRVGNIHVQALSVNELISETAVLIDADSGQVLYDKNMNKIMYPASTTKIMTGILAIENAYPTDILTVSAEAVSISEPESSNIALTAGEEITLDDALYALMLPSANDSANVIAEHVAGSQQAFAVLMNQKARLIGAANTNFENAHGLHEDSHYTTAYDLALITRYATQNTLFMRYFGADTYVMPPTNKQSAERPFSNYQYMLLKTSQFYYEGVTGGKTGYTNPAKHTMSTIATKNGRTLICVVMYSASRDDKFSDTKKLLDFGFGEFERVTMSKEKAGERVVPIMDSGTEMGEAVFSSDTDYTFLLHKSIDSASVQFEYDVPPFFEADNKSITASVSLIAKSGNEHIPALLATRQLIPQITLNALEDTQPSQLAMAPGSNPGIFDSGFAVAGGIVALIVLLVGYNRYVIAKRRKARMARINKILAVSETAAQWENKKPKSYRTNYWTK